jgi:hypothetical protein
MTVLRKRATILGRCALVIGILIAARGVFLWSPTIIGIGIVILCGGLYALSFGRAGSF